jgi:hypothetical protein
MKRVEAAPAPGWLPYCKLRRGCGPRRPTLLSLSASNMPLSRPNHRHLSQSLPACIHPNCPPLVFMSAAARCCNNRVARSLRFALCTFLTPCKTAVCVPPPSARGPSFPAALAAKEEAPHPPTRPAFRPLLCPPLQQPRAHLYAMRAVRRVRGALPSAGEGGASGAAGMLRFAPRAGRLLRHHPAAV